MTAAPYPVQAKDATGKTTVFSSFKVFLYIFQLIFETLAYYKQGKNQIRETKITIYSEISEYTELNIFSEIWCNTWF